MDLQKEKEAFEAWFIENGIPIDTDFNVAKRAFEAGAAWQAAKAKAVPDGFVLVPKEPTLQMLKAADEHIMDVHATAESVYKAMIEAQEQSHD